MPVLTTSSLFWNSMLDKRHWAFDQGGSGLGTEEEEAWDTGFRIHSQRDLRDYKDLCMQLERLPEATVW